MPVTEQETDAPRRRTRLTLSWRVSLLIAILLVASAVITTAFAVRSIQAELQAQTEEAVGNVHAAAATLIQTQYADIERYRDEALERRKAELQDVTGPVLTTLDELRMAVAAGELTEDQARQRALNYIRSVRYGNDDYFFAYNRDLVAIAHPDKRFQGRNLTDLQDADGKYVLQEIRDVALGQGAGFVDYRWERLDGQEPSPKVGYVVHYEPWDWIIGTGVYVDDIQAEVDSRIESVKTDLAGTFEQITFAQDGFFFILDQQGKVIASGDPAVAAAAQTPQGQEDIQAILRAAPTEPGVETMLTVAAPWATSSEEQWALRLTTTGGDLDWVLVSAVPMERLERPGRLLGLQLVLLSLVVLLIGLALGLLVSRRITKPVDTITRAARDLADGTFDPTTLDTAATRKDEVGELARTFQRMGTEIVERERRLREQVEQLTVRIDRQKVEEQVQEITESDYFQRLKSRSEELRRRD